MVLHSHRNSYAVCISFWFSINDWFTLLHNNQQRPTFRGDKHKREATRHNANVLDGPLQNHDMPSSKIKGLSVLFHTHPRSLKEHRVRALVLSGPCHC